MASRQHAAIQSRGQHFPVDKTIGTPPAGAGVPLYNDAQITLGNKDEAILRYD